MTILTIAGILTCAYASHFASTPPGQAKNVTPVVTPRSVQTSITERVLALVRPVMRYGFWAKSFADAFRVAQCGFGEQRNPPSRFCFATFPPRRYIIAWVLVITGALIRRACYRELGRFFTFKVSLQAQHKLIRSGPYSIVRHPGYGACLPLFSGVILLHTDNFPLLGSAATTLLWKLEGWYNLLYIAGRLVGLNSLLRRADLEDTMLREHYGQEWIQYSRDVPYQFIPYVW